MNFQAMFPEKINTDYEISGDPAYFDWNNRRKPQERKTYVCKAPDEFFPRYTSYSAITWLHLLKTM